MPARAGVRRPATVTSGSGTTLPGAAGALTTCLLTDAGRRIGLVPLLDEIARRGGPRSDQGAAAAAASDLLVSAFGAGIRDACRARHSIPTMFVSEGGTSSASGVGAPDEGPQYAQGLALLPYGARPRAHRARRARRAGPLGTHDVAAYLGALRPPTTSRGSSGSSHSPVSQPSGPRSSPTSATWHPGPPTDLERIWLSVGLAEAGDLAGARAIGRDVLARSASGPAAGRVTLRTRCTRR